MSVDTDEVQEVRSGAPALAVGSTRDNRLRVTSLMWAVRVRAVPSVAVPAKDMATGRNRRRGGRRPEPPAALPPRRTRPQRCPLPPCGAPPPRGVSSGCPCRAIEELAHVHLHDRCPRRFRGWPGDRHRKERTHDAISRRHRQDPAHLRRRGRAVGRLRHGRAADQPKRVNLCSRFSSWPGARTGPWSSPCGPRSSPRDSPSGSPCGPWD